MTNFYDPESSSIRGYEPKSSKSWLDDYDCDYSVGYSKKYKKGTGSRSWMSKIGYGYDYGHYGESSKKQAYSDLLKQLQNSANLLGNDSLGRIRVAWSDGTNKNSLDPNGEKIVYLSPDNLLDSKHRVKEEMLDCVTGKVYLASTIRETVHPDAFKDACEARNTDSEVNKNAVGIWESIETNIARSHILENWTGFSPYIASEAEHASDSKKKVQEYVDASSVDPNLDAISTAISWNILNKHDPIEIPECYKGCVDVATRILSKDSLPENRFHDSLELSQELDKILKDKQQQPPVLPTSGGSGGENEGNSGESKVSVKGSVSSVCKNGVGKPRLCDSSLLGDKVDNKTDEELAELKNDEESGGGEIKVSASSDLSKNGEKCKKILMIPTSSDAYELSNIIKNNRSNINYIRSSLKFKNEERSLMSFGHRSGNIDENSLFKIRMDDDRIMTKTDVVASKNIAICLLVDESGSMASCGRISSAVKVAVVLAESMKTISGIDVSIYGHSAEEPYHKHECTGVIIREYYSPSQKNLSTCIQMKPRSQNLDGYAIMHTANFFKKDYPYHEKRIIFVISDGEPGGSNYFGPSAMKHMYNVKLECKKHGIDVFGIGIENAFEEEEGNLMYGKNEFVILKDVDSSLGVITRFINQIAKK